LLRLFFVQRAAVRPGEPVYAPDGTRLKYQGMRQTTYYSVFGKVRFKRHYFHAPGHKGVCPLDAELSLPPRCYSDLLRDWAEYCITNESHDESVKVLQRILGLSISKLALEGGVQEDAADVAAFYEQKAVPSPKAEGSILVVQADGKGVPMVRTEPAAQPARRGKGQKRTKKKEAVALTDGDEALQRRVDDRLPRFSLILDIIHASEYLWDAANALLGETNPDRTAWVEEHLLRILSGRTTDVIHTLESRVRDPSLSPFQRKALNTTIGYYRRNLPYMRYDQCLAQGWPIGTGVAEGACGHLVKDRMEQSGMRWTQPGAQAVLDLRAVRVNDDWDEYQHFRRQRQHERLYGPYSTAPPMAETIVLRKTA